jgi:hypothetical protein
MAARRDPSGMRTVAEATRLDDLYSAGNFFHGHIGILFHYAGLAQKNLVEHGLVF